MTVLAVTGGTGFVGGHLLRIAAERGHAVSALARQPQGTLPGVTWVLGALDRPAALAKLVAGADAVIHVAGVINARDRTGFAAGNIDGTVAMLHAAEAAGVRRFIHVSSLAAREPALSDYGWSKRESELPVARSPLDWTIVRPPAIYGPGDREMLELFRIARRGFVPLPPAGRLSVIAAEDLCRLMLDLLEAPDSLGKTYEPDDARAQGWSHGAFARAVGAAVGRRVVPLPVPQVLLRLGAWADTRLRGGGAKLTPDRVRYFCHPDWTAAAERKVPPALWVPQVETGAGLKVTAEWYRKRGWL